MKWSSGHQGIINTVGALVRKAFTIRERFLVTETRIQDVHFAIHPAADRHSVARLAARGKGEGCVVKVPQMGDEVTWGDVRDGWGLG